jgi:hypothetical protein
MPMVSALFTALALISTGQVEPNVDVDGSKLRSERVARLDADRSVARAVTAARTARERSRG